jgi:hypothetical protein
MKAMTLVFAAMLVGCAVEVADVELEDGGHVWDATDDAGEVVTEDAGDVEHADAGDLEDDAGVCVLYCVRQSGADFCYAAGLPADAYPVGIRCREWEQ